MRPGKPNILNKFNKYLGENKAIFDEKPEG
jgi:hypothetical protein